MSVAVKICGVCSPADAAVAARAGADFIGVILAPGRTRSRTVEEAAAIYAAAPSRRAGVFVDAAVDDVLRAVDRLRLDVVQLHGAESPEYVHALRDRTPVELWKAVAVRTSDDVCDAASQWAGTSHGLLLEGWSARGSGGVGASFDWAAAAGVRAAVPPALRLILAGGLNAGNVAHAVALLRPDVADVSSGVEQSVGRKSPAQVAAFIAAARNATHPAVPAGGTAAAPDAAGRTAERSTGAHDE